MRTLLRGETMETQEALLERQRDGAYGRPPRRVPFAEVQPGSKTALGKTPRLR